MRHNALQCLFWYWRSMYMHVEGLCLPLDVYWLIRGSFPPVVSENKKVHALCVRLWLSVREQAFQSSVWKQGFEWGSSFTLTHNSLSHCCINSHSVCVNRRNLCRNLAKLCILVQSLSMSHLSQSHRLKHAKMYTGLQAVKCRLIWYALRGAPLENLPPSSISPVGGHLAPKG